MSATYTHSFIGENLAKDMYVVPPSRLINEIPYAMKQLEVSHYYSLNIVQHYFLA